MAVTVATRGTPLHSTTDGTSFTMTDAGTPTASRLLLAAVSRGNGSTAPTGFTGYNVSWTLLPDAQILSSGSFGWVGFFVALSGGSPDSTDPVCTFAASANGLHIVMHEITLTSYAGTAAECFRDQGSAIRTVGATGFGTTATGTLASAANANNRPFSAVHTFNGAAITPRASWSELNDGSFITPTSDLETQWRSDTFETTASGTWTGSSEWQILATEIIDDAGAGGGGAATLDPMGMSGFFGA